MNALNKKKNDWFDQFSGYIILAGIIAVVAGFGISRIFRIHASPYQQCFQGIPFRNARMI